MLTKLNESCLGLHRKFPCMRYPRSCCSTTIQMPPPTINIPVVAIKALSKHIASLTFIVLVLDWPHFLQHKFCSKMSPDWSDGSCNLLFKQAAPNSCFTTQLQTTEFDWTGLENVILSCFYWGDVIYASSKCSFSFIFIWLIFFINHPHFIQVLISPWFEDFTWFKK